MSAGLSVSRLTAAGRGAVAVIRVQCQSPDDAEILERHFRSASGRSVATADIGHILYGYWQAEDVVVVRINEREWEVHCHGGEAAVSRITDDLGGDTEPPITTRDIEQLLLAKLLKCRTQKTAHYLLAQQQGVYFDFLLRVVESNNAEETAIDIGRFLQRRSFAQHLTDPWNVAVTGQPNAGKSSLLNRIVGYERSIVFDRPGTTRDLVEVDIVLDGWPFRFIDTAGLRTDTADSIEAIGVSAAYGSIAKADACLLVVDAAVGWTDTDASLLKRLPAERPIAVLWNKSDLCCTDSLPCLSQMSFQTSAKTGDSIGSVIEWVPEVLLTDIPEPDEPLPVVPELNLEFEQFLVDRDLPRLQMTVRSWLT